MLPAILDSTSFWPRAAPAATKILREKFGKKTLKLMVDVIGGGGG